MPVTIIRAKRDDSPENVNPKFHTPDGKVIPRWKTSPEVSSKDYYLTPCVSYCLFSNIRAGQCPPGYIVERNETFAVGKTVKVFTRCERIMSDVWEDVTYAVVNNPENNETPWETVRVAITGSWGEWGGSWGTAEVDAPAELIQEYETWVKNEHAQRERAANELRARSYRATLEKGKIVQVVTGRKVPKGTVGKVFWIGSDQYGQKCGIALTPRKGKTTKNGKTFDSYLDVVFVATKNVQVLGAESQESMELVQSLWETGETNLPAALKEAQQAPSV